MVDYEDNVFWYSEANERPDDSICTPLLNGSDLSDGRIPVILGFGTGISTGILILYVLLRYFAPRYTTVVYLADGDEEQGLPNRGDFLVKKRFNWLNDLFFLGLKDVKTKCGPDAYSYLNLLLHLIFVMFIVSIFSISIILPINYNIGDQHPEGQGFARTTMTNVNPSSGVLWIHTIFAVFYLILIAATMYYYIIQLGKHQIDYSTSSIIIQGAPVILGKEDIQQHFEEAEFHPTDIQLTFNVSKLIKLHNKYIENKEQLEIAQNVKHEGHNEIDVHNGINKAFSCCDPGVNAIAYYENQCLQLHEELKIERELVSGKRLPLLFITLSSQGEANRIINGYRLFQKLPKSSLSNALQSNNWKVSAAPFPRDISWENLSVYGSWWWIRWIVLNLCLVFCLFFFTTPSVVLSGLDLIRVRLFNDTGEEIYRSSPFITNYIPTLLTLIFSSLMPYLVARSTYLEAHWAKSFREQIILRKTYIFLIIMVIILPSVSLTSLRALAADARNRATLSEQLNCAFLPNNGGYFIGYIITAALIGTSLEWIRIISLVKYLYWRFKAKSSAQRAYANKMARMNFQYGIQYAYVLMIFAIAITLSVTSPIAAPFGLVYLIFKYYVDKYNIYNVCFPTSLHGCQSLHRNAVNFVMTGGFLLQVCLLCYLVLRKGDVAPVSVFMIVMFSFALFIWVLSMFFDLFSYMMPTIRLKLGKEITIFKSESDRYQAFEGDIMAKDSYIPLILTDKQWKTERLLSSVDENYQSLSCMREVPSRPSYLTDEL